MFYYSLNGAQAGPVSEEQLRQLISTGTITPETLIWREGMADWQPYSAVLGPSPAPTPTYAATVPCSVCKQTFPPDQVIRYGNLQVCAACKPRFVQGLREGATPPETDRRALYQIALNQRRALLCVGIAIACNVAQIFLAGRFPIGSIVLALGMIASGILTMIAVYRLARSLGFSGVLYLIAMFIPCLGLLALLYVVSKATTALKKAGVQVGFLGVSKATLNELRS